MHGCGVALHGADLSHGIQGRLDGILMTKQLTYDILCILHFLNDLVPLALRPTVHKAMGLAALRHGATCTLGDPARDCGKWSAA